MSDPVRQTVELGLHWPTIDPFLFCAHHDDAYPEGQANLGPDPALLAGRDIGMDFEGRDGWRMYHGQRVPGFPPHPHRGFETITYVRKGIIDHADSLGAAARFGRGDVQWLTAGQGIQHSEMFPLLDPDGPNPLELFQIWLNLPSADKMVDAHFTMLWDDQIPRLVSGPDDGPKTTVTVIAGRLPGAASPPDPPPASYASHAEADLGIWHIVLEPGASWTLPRAEGRETIRTLYVFDGTALRIAGHDADLARDTGVVVDSQVDLDLSSEPGPQRPAADEGGDNRGKARHRDLRGPAEEGDVAGPPDARDSRSNVEVLVLQGRPLGEPVARHGPFVMTTRAQIQEAFEDYQRTQFGGWPWADDDPVHPADQPRFARHADGRVEERQTTPSTPA